MTKFNTLIESLNILSAPIVEHCKVGPFFKPYNLLELEILKTLYLKYLKDTSPDFYDTNITDYNELIVTFFDKLPIAMELLGNELCRTIPNEKTLKYTGYDLNNWADKLYNLIVAKKSKYEKF